MIRNNIDENVVARALASCEIAHAVEPDTDEWPTFAAAAPGSRSLPPWSPQWPEGGRQPILYRDVGADHG